MNEENWDIGKPKRIKPAVYLKAMKYQEKRHREDGLILYNINDILEEALRENEFLRGELERKTNALP